MKKLFILLLLAGYISFTKNQVAAQCGVGYTQAQLNWDNLDYYFNSGGAAPYDSYVSNTMEQTQRFAIGTNWLTIAASSNALITTSENATHTGDIAGYTGQDMQYTSVAGRTITITFNTPVLNANFTLYDVDRSAVFNVTAADPASGALAVTATPQASTILTITGTPGKTITANATTLGTIAENRGTVTIAVAGSVSNPVKSITITCTTVGSDAAFWLSDINACVTGSFPTNWHQGFNNRPFVGPTQNQPDYFIVTPDNKSVYMMDPATGKCYFLFSEIASAPYVNSFAYDPANKYLYYVLDGSGTPSTNKALKRYNFNTEQIEAVLVPDITAAPFNIPVFDQGVESAAASFYNGILYFGVEGGRSGTGGSTVTRETIVWAINFDASQNPINANQVFAADAYKNASDSAVHDWADFIIRNGVLFDFNTARAGSSPSFTYKYSSYGHYNMMTGNLFANYQNPSFNATYTGQAGMTWQGQLYFVRDSVGLYNENGTNSNTRYKSVVVNVPGDPVPPAWAGGAGDASDPFRPKCDFGDAPASYDPYATPATQSPAVHERSELIRLGATWDKEFWKKGTTGIQDTDDGIASLSFLPPGANGYVVQVSAFNNSGANATMIAWLDYNGNGIFDAGEAITPITVPTSASAQNFWLYWPSTPNTFVSGQSTYLRVRITAQTAGMTTAHSTGYFTNGEVEDYRVQVDNFPLATHLLSFDAVQQNKTVKLNWKVAEDAGIYAYDVERSSDNVNWSKINTVNANGTNGTFSYQITDANPYIGDSYYRLRLIESTGMNKLSAVKHILIKDLQTMVTIAPNPVKDQMTVRLQASENGAMEINILNIQGNLILRKGQRFNTGLNNFTLMLPAAISNGTYIVRIVVDGDIINKKLIVNR